MGEVIKADRKCSKCSETKPPSEFYRPRDSACKVCWRKQVSEYQKRNRPKIIARIANWIRENPDKHKEYCRRSSIRKRYGLTHDQYEAMFAAQDGRCAICRTRAEDAPRRILAIDHCHSTGKIRGLLCDSCNHGVGMFKDSPELMKAAIDYLGASRGSDEKTGVIQSIASAMNGMKK